MHKQPVKQDWVVTPTHVFSVNIFYFAMKVRNVLHPKKLECQENNPE